jgi:hypothetical protein
LDDSWFSASFWQGVFGEDPAPYECILAYYDSHGRRGRGWLRLYRHENEAIAVIAEVAGNTGPSISEAILEIGALLVERFRLNPLRLTLVDYYPPDSLGGHRGEFNRVHLTWLEDRFAHPRWEPIDLKDLQGLVGQPVEDQPFWQPLQTRGWYRCQVGTRATLVHPVDVDEWQAIVNRDQATVNIQRGFCSQVEAQTWGLDQLSHLAAEYE